jgi:hypothetical protein
LRITVQDAPGSGRERIRYEVLDTGPGIPPQDQARIFKKFVQLPNQSARQRGAGLGLAICRDLLELMGGEIDVSSQIGRGSNFHFVLPLEAAPAMLPAAQETNISETHIGSQAGANDSIHILVAEDTEDNRTLLEYYLRSEPVKLRFAFTGQEAVDAVQRGEKFHLILMDIDMPEMDGFAAARAIRAWETPRGLSTPIVALSADAMNHAVRQSLECGCAAHVAKPVDRTQLLATIQRYASASLPSLNIGASAKVAATLAVSEQVLALVPQYLASKQKQIEEARRSLSTRDFGPIRRFGHNLKGTGSGYGFPAIEELGRQIERAAAEADVDRIARQLDALHRLVTESATTADSVSTARP